MEAIRAGSRNEIKSLVPADCWYHFNAWRSEPERVSQLDDWEGQIDQ